MDKRVGVLDMNEIEIEIPNGMIITIAHRQALLTCAWYETDVTYHHNEHKYRITYKELLDRVTAVPNKSP